MEIQNVEMGKATVTLSADELLIVNNAINEICNALDVAEFSTRIGASVDEARSLLRQVGELCDRVTV